MANPKKAPVVETPTPEAPAPAMEFAFEQEQTVIYLEAPSLNPLGLESLEAYREAHGEVPTFNVDKVPTEHYPVGVNFPYPEGGLEQYIIPEFLAAWKAKWNAEVMGRGVGVELTLDKFVKGQARIDLNRDRTPAARKMLCKTDATAKVGKAATKKVVGHTL